MKKITHWEGFEAIRKRPKMYVGNTKIRGVIVIFQEVIKMLNYELNWVHLTIICKNNQFIIRLKQPMTYTNEINNLHPYRNIESHQKEFSVLGFSGVIALSKRIELRFKNRSVIYKDSKEVKNEIQEKVANFEMRFELDETIMEATTIPIYTLKQHFKLYLELSDFDNRTIEIIKNNHCSIITKEGGLRYVFDSLQMRIAPIYTPIEFTITDETSDLKANIIFSIIPQYTNDIVLYYEDFWIPRHGTPVDGFLKGLANVGIYHGKTHFAEYIGKGSLKNDDLGIGITAVIQIKCVERLDYTSSWKGKVFTPELRPIFEKLTFEALKNNSNFIKMLDYKY